MANLDPGRCVSTHWSLPVQCVRPRTHRDNWHEAWDPKTGNLLRYRYPGRLTEEYRGGEWHTVAFANPAMAESAVARLRGILARDMSRDAIDQLLTEVATEQAADTGVNAMNAIGELLKAGGLQLVIVDRVAFCSSLPVKIAPEDVEAFVDGLIRSPNAPFAAAAPEAADAR